MLKSVLNDCRIDSKLMQLKEISLHRLFEWKIQNSKVSQILSLLFLVMLKMNALRAYSIRKGHIISIAFAQFWKSIFINCLSKEYLIN